MASSAAATTVAPPDKMKPINAVVDRIPTEVLDNILRCCEDPETLRNLALSTPAFYATFINQQTQITTNVMEQAFGPLVYRDASLAMAASRIPTRPKLDWNAFITYANEHFSRRMPTISWTLREALASQSLHRIVEHLTGELAREFIKRRPQLRGQPQPEGVSSRELSTAEICRIQRALYRWQMCCLVWPAREDPYSTGPLPHVRPANVWSVITKVFCLYELEQLACLNYYLAILIMPAFNSLVVSDITWGYREVDPISNDGDGRAQQILSHGLGMTYALITAETLEERRIILEPNEDPDEKPMYRHDFLCQHLATHLDTSILPPTRRGMNPFWHMAPENEPPVEDRPPFHVDADPGPVRLWERYLQQRRSQPRGFAAKTEFNTSIRRWATVFYDEDRLEHLGVFCTPWREYSWDLKDFSESIGLTRTIGLRNSRKERSRLWKRGGRGFVDFEPNSAPVPYD